MYNILGLILGLIITITVTSFILWLAFKISEYKENNDKSNLK
jgi:hypothetical protein